MSYAFSTVEYLTWENNSCLCSGSRRCESIVCHSSGSMSEWRLEPDMFSWLYLNGFICYRSKYLRLSYCKTRNFCECNLCIFVCDKFCENVFLRFLLLVYRQSIEQRNICAFNICDWRKSLKNAKIRRTQEFPVLQVCGWLPLYKYVRLRFLFCCKQLRVWRIIASVAF